MKSSFFRLFLPMVLVITLFSCSTNSSEDLTISELITEYDSSISEMELASVINDYRVSIGKNAFEIINHMSYKSHKHNMYMIQNNLVNHDNFESRANNIMQVLGAVSVGENVAYNFSLPNAVLNAWLNSPSHKANLDSDFTHFGVSISIGSNGKKYYTNIFMKR